MKKSVVPLFLVLLLAFVVRGETFPIVAGGGGGLEPPNFTAYLKGFGSNKQLPQYRIIRYGPNQKISDTAACIGPPIIGGGGGPRPRPTPWFEHPEAFVIEITQLPDLADNYRLNGDQVMLPKGSFTDDFVSITPRVRLALKGLKLPLLDSLNKGPLTISDFTRNKLRPEWACYVATPQ
jgi:hypothetical protein